MFKSNLFRKSLSLIMAMVLLVGIVSPGVYATAEANAEKYYYAMGDAMTLGVGLDLVEDENGEEDLPAYYVEIAKALAEDGIIDDAGSYYVEAKKRYRIEELRYLIDADYAGDGYTKSIGGLKTLRDKGQVKSYVANAEVISIAAGTNNFSTYIVEQMMYYLENGGAVKYSYSFDEFAGQEVWSSMETIRDLVMDKLTAAAPDQGDQALELIEYIAEISVYAVMSYITSFNALITTIYELNPDAQIYVIGQYNPVAGENLTYEIGGKTLNIPIGDFFGALVELANAYAQILAPRAYDYTYVDPGDPELLIDQMGNTNLDRYDRIPTGLMIELINEAGDAAIQEVVQIFKDNGVDDYDEDDAAAFLTELVACETPEERNQVIMEELNAVVSDKVYEAFVDEMTEYLGQFGDAKNVVTADEIMDLLADLDAAADEAARESVAADFVDDLISDPELQNQAAAQVIYEYIEAYGLSDYVTVENVVELLEAMAKEGADREAVATAWVHNLAVVKITTYVQDIVGESYTTAMAEEMLNAMEASDNPKAVAKEALWNDVFADYLSEMIEAKFEEKGLSLINYDSFDAFVNAIYVADDDYEEVVRETILASGAAEVSEISLNIYTTEEIIALFSEMDGLATDAAKKSLLETNLKTKFGSLYNVFGGAELLNKFWSAYTSYVAAAETTITLVGQYLDGVDTAADALADYVAIQESIVDQILDVYEENFDSESGSLDLSGFADFNELRQTAIDKILNGYEDYAKAIEQAKSSAATFDEELDPVYELLESIAEIDTINLNHLLEIVKVLQNPADYEGTDFEGFTTIEDIKNNIMTGQDLPEELKTVGYLAIRYYLADAMMIMPSANGHATIAAQVVKAINGENTNSTAGDLANKVINGGLDIYHLTKEFLSKPTTGSGQVGTLINPENYLAIGDNISTGDSYVDMLAEALAMEFNDDGYFDEDIINNLSIDGIRTVELLAMLSDDYDGDAYTEARFGSDYIESERAKLQAAIADAELITLNIGINDLVTYPMKQALLAYNGEETYEMDWERFFSSKRVNQLTNGKDAVMDLLLFIADNVDSRIVDPITGKSAYDEAETALTTVSTAVEALVYSMLNYVVNLDASVEAIAEQNETATIVLVGFYNPMEDTYVNIDREVSVGDKDVDLSQYTVNTSALTEKILNQANRFLTNYVGNIAGDGTAADEGSRVVTVSILDTELLVSDTDASKDLSTLTDWRTVSVFGKDITIKIPEYLYETLVTGGEALHPNANGHQYICNQILDALNFEIHADVVPQNNSKVYGDADPELVFNWDDASSLFHDGTLVKLTREEGENVGTYKITATVEANGGYHEIDLEEAVFTITYRPITVDVKVLDGVISEVTVADGTIATRDEGVDLETLLGLSVNAEGTEVTYDNANYDVTINATFETTEVMQEGTIVMNSLSLYLESEVHYNVKYTLTGFNMDQVVEIGVLRYLSDKGKENSFYDNADEYIVFDSENGERDGEKYVARTSGVSAKNLGDDTYFKAYVKLKDGTYRYSPRYVSSAVRYTDKIFDGTNVGLQRLCIALLNYGSAAQVYFAEQGNYTYETLMNTTYMADEYQSMVDDFNLGMIDARLASNSSIYGEFGVNSGKISNGVSNLSLLGAISLNLHSFNYDPTDVEECGFVIWNHEAYAKGEVLTRENATDIIVSDEIDGSLEYSILGIAASGMCDTYVASPYIMIDGVYYYRNIYRVSVDAYAEKIINGDYSEAMINLAKYMVVYGEYAEKLFK